MKSETIKKTGKFDGKSNKLGHGGRAKQLEAEGVPGGVIGDLARKADAAPGQKNYHGGRKKKAKNTTPNDIYQKKAAMSADAGKSGEDDQSDQDEDELKAKRKKAKDDEDWKKEKAALQPRKRLDEPVKPKRGESVTERFKKHM